MTALIRNFVFGVGSLLDLYGNAASDRSRRILATSTFEAIRKDWDAIGGDMYYVMYNHGAFEKKKPAVEKDTEYELA